MEAELKRRGETVEWEPVRPPPVKGRKVYHANNRVKVWAEGWEDDGDDGTLVMHEDGGDGTALCGTPARDWTDPKTGIRHRGMWRRYGPGPVDCGSCINI